eukprot:3516403-Pyramimonas_sp.AAC.1
MAIDGSHLERLDSPASDRKLMHVRIRPRAQRPHAERGTPAYFFQPKFYANAIEYLTQNTDYDNLAPI